MPAEIPSPTAAYSSADVYRCEYMAGAFPGHTHRSLRGGGGEGLMGIRHGILTFDSLIYTTRLMRSQKKS